MRPTLVPPVKQMRSQRSVRSAWLASTPPSTTETTSGAKASPSIRASTLEVAGDSSLGFTTALRIGGREAM
jgi:hypothetical protein